MSLTGLTHLQYHTSSQSMKNLTPKFETRDKKKFEYLTLFCADVGGHSGKNCREIFLLLESPTYTWTRKIFMKSV